MGLGIYHFYPKRIVQMGAWVLLGSFLIALPILAAIYLSEIPALSSKEKKEQVGKIEAVTFNLGVDENHYSLPSIELHGEMTFSFDRPRPDSERAGENLLVVRLKKGAESKRMELPARIDLEYRGDRLKFAKEKSPFWVEVSEKVKGQVEARGFFESLDGQVLEAGCFVVPVQEAPVQTAQEFLEGSCFKMLAEAKWWGRDLIREDQIERLEVGSLDLIEFGNGDWLVWKDKKWQKVSVPDKELPIARIEAANGKALVLEGWGESGHVRLSLPLAVASPFKMKGEEIFSAVRARSEKQMSCMLEKQCMILKVGDWVLKANGRWKVLRKEMEKEAYLKGKLVGELFVFEQISQKQGQKMIQGRLFNPGRTQVIPVELVAQTTQKKGHKRRSS